MKTETEERWIIAVAPAINAVNEPCLAVLRYDDGDRYPKIYWGPYTTHPYYPSFPGLPYIKRCVEDGDYTRPDFHRGMVIDYKNVWYEKVTKTTIIETISVDENGNLI